LIHKEGIDANEAFYRCGLTSDRKIGSSQGAIGLLTKGRISRKYSSPTSKNTFRIFPKNILFLMKKPLTMP